MSHQDVSLSPTCSAFLADAPTSTDYAHLAFTLVTSYGASPAEPDSARVALETFLATHPGLTEEDKDRMREKEGYVVGAVQDEGGR